jgi:hypothetical protein
MPHHQISIENSVPAAVTSPTSGLISFYEKELSLSPAPRVTCLLKNDAIHPLTSLNPTLILTASPNI